MCKARHTLACFAASPVCWSVTAVCGICWSSLLGALSFWIRPWSSVVRFLALPHQRPENLRLPCSSTRAYVLGRRRDRWQASHIPVSARESHSNCVPSPPFYQSLTVFSMSAQVCLRRLTTWWCTCDRFSVHVVDTWRQTQDRMIVHWTTSLKRQSPPTPGACCLSDHGLLAPSPPLCRDERRDHNASCRCGPGHARPADTQHRMAVESRSCSVALARV